MANAHASNAVPEVNVRDAVGSLVGIGAPGVQPHMLPI